LAGEFVHQRVDVLLRHVIRIHTGEGFTARLIVGASQIERVKSDSGYASDGRGNEKGS
jgi:hypothetical protein